MKTFLRRCAPPGMPLKAEIYTACIGFAAAALYGLMRFLNDYTRQRSLLLRGKPVEMPAFFLLFKGDLRGFAVMAFVIAGFTVFRYAYLYRGSKSVYSLRRLPEKAPVAKRVLLVPAIELLICGILAFLLLLLCFWIYMHFSPADCIAPDQWALIWRGN